MIETKLLRLMQSFFACCFAFLFWQAHKQLSPHSRLEAGNDLDSYLDAIVRSSMGVANTCEGERRDRIVQACQSVSVVNWQL